MQFPAIRAGLHPESLPEIFRCAGLAVVDPDAGHIQSLPGVNKALRHHNHILGGVAVDGVGSFGAESGTVVQHIGRTERQGTVVV